MLGAAAHNPKRTFMYAQILTMTGDTVFAL
jgi:hypothetical protein